jgi:hypothetical protein
VRSSQYAYFRVLRIPIAQFFCFQVRISDLELYENILISVGNYRAIVDICGVHISEQNILNKLSRNLSHFSITEFGGKSNDFLVAEQCLHVTQKW